MRLLLFTLIFLPTVVSSQPEFVVSGTGSISCGKFVESEGGELTKIHQTAWAQGFLSGMNMADAQAGKGTILIPDPDSIQVYLRNFCNDNPLERVFHGLIELYNEVRSRGE